MLKGLQDSIGSEPKMTEDNLSGKNKKTRLPTTKTSRSHSARNFQELVIPTKDGEPASSGIKGDKTNLLMKTAAISNEKKSTGGSVRSKKSTRSVHSRKSRKNSSTGVRRKMTNNQTSEQASNKKV